MNKKGFSLVELIGMIVVLGILMLITVPNIAGILKNNRENIVVEDVSKMATNAKNKFSTKQASYPRSNLSCVVMTLNFLDSNNDFKQGLNGGSYNTKESFVVVRKELENASTNTYTYRYYVRLVEDVKRNNSVQKYELALIEQNELINNPKKYLTNLAPATTGDMTALNTSDALSLINSDSIKRSDYMNGFSCSEINAIYTS